MLLKLCILFALVSVVLLCPAEEALHPCVCEVSVYSKHITCDGLDNDQQLINAAYSLKGMEDIYSFVIENAILNYIPHNLFEGVRLVELEFLKSSFMAFTDTNVAFVGLENSLEILLVTECSFMNDWDWSLLKNMKKIMRLDIIGGDLESIGDDVREISSLNMIDVSFAENRISYIYEYAFTNFTELTFLTLNNNLIEEIKRSMLPNPASKLLQIDLGHNKIRQFPPDMFQNMPKLELLTVSSNKLLTLNEQTFSPIWEQLEHFSAMGNELRCDCRLVWITKYRMPADMRAICDSPREVSGKNLNMLTVHDLWC